ncbi:MAG: hypothetical protein P1U70_20500 [Saprospiraceae bacterium]|jgi:hypothetical protein|nr:hypothetical protein [Saprospiraceae bacterium]
MIAFHKKADCLFFQFNKDSNRLNIKLTQLLNLFLMNEALLFGILFIGVILLNMDVLIPSTPPEDND